MKTMDFGVKDRQMMGIFSLQKMANETGGKYYGNILNYEKNMQNIQDITGSYYVLGYYIDEKWDGKYHKIKVNVKREGCEARAQTGYFNPKPFKKLSKLEKRIHLLDLILSEDLKQAVVLFVTTAHQGDLGGRLGLQQPALVVRVEVVQRGGQVQARPVLLALKRADAVEVQPGPVDHLLP